MSKVSVVVPIYNAEQKINKCIKSILNQTFKDFELILVNDGSTDNSLKVCKKYQKTDKRIMVINKNNEGSIATRRRGVEASNSDYIMFVDADDWIDKKMIEVLYNETVQNDTDITVCNIYRSLGSGRVLKKLDKTSYFNEDKIYLKEEIKKEIITAYLWGHPFPAALYAKLYKKELVLNSGKYLSRIHFSGDDLYYNLEIFTKCNKVKVINRPLYYYRVGGFTSKYMPYFFNDMINGYQIQKEIIEEYFLDSKQEQYNGISIMLLNTFKTSLYNLFNSKYNANEIKSLIAEYVSNDHLTECFSNEGCKEYFSKEFLHSIKNQDVEYLYRIGEGIYRKRRPKKTLLELLSRFSII